MECAAAVMPKVLLCSAFGDRDERVHHVGVGQKAPTVKL